MKNALMNRSQARGKHLNAKLAKVSKRWKKSASRVTSDLKEGAVEHSQDVAIKVDKAVRRSPWYFLGGTAATSVIAGAMFGLRARKQNLQERRKRH